MTNETLGDSIQNQVDNAIETIPKPLQCIITKNYPKDMNHVDILLNDGSTMKTIPIIGVNTVNLPGILLFLDGDETKPIVITSTTEIFTRLGFNQQNQEQFNHAIITNGINIEYWILANAYYDYTNSRFVKINPATTSFGIMLQAAGTYPGEEGIDPNNNSIGIWRNPKTADVYKDTTNYDYTDMENKGWIGCKRLSDSKWIEFGISAGWSNTLMLDAYGGITIGGAGLEIDGNGIFPFTRLTSSVYSINGTSYYLLGLLDNAYHPTFGNDSVWGCDSNSTYSWFVGLKIPEESYLKKDNMNASFVVMYNDTEMPTTGPHADDTHYLDKEQWHIVFEVNTGGVVE